MLLLLGGGIYYERRKGLRMSINDFDLELKTSIHYPFVNFIFNIHILETRS
jgi:hypothetical protein